MEYDNTFQKLRTRELFEVLAIPPHNAHKKVEDVLTNRIEDDPYEVWRVYKNLPPDIKKVAIMYIKQHWDKLVSHVDFHRVERRPFLVAHTFELPQDEEEEAEDPVFHVFSGHKQRSKQSS
jgi:hypothetical protein